MLLARVIERKVSDDMAILKQKFASKNTQPNTNKIAQ